MATAGAAGRSEAGQCQAEQQLGTNMLVFVNINAPGPNLHLSQAEQLPMRAAASVSGWGCQEAISSLIQLLLLHSDRNESVWQQNVLLVSAMLHPPLLQFCAFFSGLSDTRISFYTSSGIWQSPFEARANTALRDITKKREANEIGILTHIIYFQATLWVNCSPEENIGVVWNSCHSARPGQAKEVGGGEFKEIQPGQV